ncbi:hypothetical protein L3Q82_009135, partial [Scortum barcoo]
MFTSAPILTVPDSMQQFIVEVDTSNEGHRLFLLAPLRSQVIHWAHTSLLTCHTGSERTTFVIKQRFWWPSLSKDVVEAGLDEISPATTSATASMVTPIAGYCHRSASVE